MKIRANMGRQYAPILPQEQQVDKVIELPNALFASFVDQPLNHYEFIRDNEVEPHQYDGFGHCLLVLGEERSDGVLVQCGEDGYADYAAYVAGARDIVQAMLNRVADFIIRQGTERTASGDWYVYCEELEARFGVTIREGNGLDSMMRETLERRPEVAQVEMSLEHIETTFRPEFCAGLRGSGLEEKPDIRLKDLLPLLTLDGWTSICHEEETDKTVQPEDLQRLTASGREDHAALLNARVSEIVPTSEGTKVMLTDVAPEELERFNEAFDAFMEAEEAMWSM